MKTQKTSSFLKLVLLPIGISLICFSLRSSLENKYRNPYYQKQQTSRSAGMIVKGIPIPFFSKKEAIRPFSAEERKDIETRFRKPAYVKNILHNKKWYKNTGLRSLLSTVAWISFIIGALGLWDAIKRVFSGR